MPNKPQLLIVTDEDFVLGRADCGSDALEVGCKSFRLGTLLPKQDCVLQLWSKSGEAGNSVDRGSHPFLSPTPSYSP